MSLSPTTHLAKTDSAGVSFLMVDHDRDCVVRVDVPREQLIALGSSAAYAPGRDLATFESHRGEVEEIARSKYDGGGYHDYANSRVVVLARADWGRSRGDRVGT
jgi:hypothetical protein